MQYLRILAAAIFVSLQDVFNDAFATASKQYELLRNEEAANFINYSAYKAVMLSHERVASLMRIPTSLSDSKFREKFMEKITKLTEEQRQALLLITQVRPMQVSAEANVKFSFGSPVYVAFVAVNRSAFLAEVEPDPNNPETFSALGHAQSVLGIPVTDESGLQLMLSPREVVGNRTTGKAFIKGAASSLFDTDDDIDEDEDLIEDTPNPTLYTEASLSVLSTDGLKQVIAAYPNLVVKTNNGKVNKAATIAALVGQPVI